MNQRTSQPLNSALRRRQLRTKKSRWSLPPDLVLSVATTLVLSLLIRVDVLEPIRFVAGLAVGLVIPGYLLVAWVFPKPDSLKGWERMGVILAINISIELFPLCGKFGLWITSLWHYMPDTSREGRGGGVA
ncbi:MAG: hypothetical protein C7B43_21485, partial [Sulfobacillus benefaciens]